MTVQTTMPTLAELILRPRSIAIVGASDNPAKTTGRPQRYLERSGFSGSVYYINPHRESVQGAKAWPDLSSLPEAPDHVYVMTGADQAIDVVRECAAIGTPVATILASGFSESGPAGREREDRLREAASDKVRLIGPSSLGVVNPNNGLLLTSNAAFGEPDVPIGGTFVASQSGSVIGAIVSRARGRGIGFSGLVSVGGEADLSVGAICRAALEDPAVTSFALFMESLNQAEDLASFAQEANKAGKPVTVFKLGSSDAAAELSVSHTGALAGSDAEAEAFFRACGFARVHNFEALIETPSLLEIIPAQNRPEPPRIGVVTTTGGGAAILVEQLALSGANIVAPSAALIQSMAGVGVEVPPSLIVDLGLAGTRHDIVTNALQTMQDSGEFDMIVFSIGSSARLNPELAVKAIADCAGHEVPLAAFTVPEAPAAADLLNSAGVPTFRTAESCADAINAAFSRTPTNLAAIRTQASDGPSEVLDEEESSFVLRDVGVPMARSTAVHFDELTEDFHLPFDYPVAVKILHEEVPHKSDVGGVILNVGDDDELRSAASQIRKNVSQHLPEVNLDRILVQQMSTESLAEALIGYKVSSDVGPVVVLSTGGVLTELFKDSSIRMAPLDLDTAYEMITEIRGLAPINGYRNLPLGDTRALAETIVAVSRLAEKHPEVQEADVNPVHIRRQGKGILALDALVRRIKKSHHEG